MRTPSIATVQYVPNEVPANAADMQRFFREELDRIAAAIRALAEGHLDKTTVAPLKPRDGDIRYADGTSWNPGSGVGIYFYKGATSSWVFLG